MAAGRFGDDARVLDLSRLSGGASQALWSFDGEASGARHELVLRRNPGETVERETAAGMETKARLMRLAQEAGAPFWATIASATHSTPNSVI